MKWPWHRRDEELSEEIRAHLDMAAREREERCEPAADARAAARREFGNATLVKETTREMWGWGAIERLWQDVRYGLRMMRRSPGFTIVAVLTLALGIGANTAIFTVINAVMLRMLPVENPQQLVVLGDPGRVHSWSSGNPETISFSYPLYCEVRDHNEVFSSVLASAMLSNLRISIDGSHEGAHGRLVSGNYFETLGVKPLLGRTFTSEDDRTPSSDPVVVISYAYWHDRFSGDPSAIGRTVRLNNYPFTIIGVAPPGFYGEVVGDRADLWAPMMMEPELWPGHDFLESPNISALLLIGRLRPGITIDQAHANVNRAVRQALTQALAARLSADDRAAMQHANLDVEVTPGGRGPSRVRKEFSSPLVFLMGLVELVLLVACVNVANLMLARSAARQREIAIRLAIGGTRGRIAFQLLTESVLLAFVGGALGLLFASWGSHALVRLVEQNGNSVFLLGLDWRVLCFTAGVCLLAGVLFGLAPAVASLRPDLGRVLKEGGRDASGPRGRGRMGRILLSAQIALGFLVLMVAGLLVRSLRNLQDVDLGYSRDELVLAKVDILASGRQGAAVKNIIRELLESLSTLPGVRTATVSSNGLYSGHQSSDGIRVEGFVPSHRGDSAAADDEVGPGYFSTIGVPIVLGREINQEDFQSAAHIAVVNETFAQFYFSDRNPLGRKIYVQDSDHPGEPPYEIIGVARDVRDRGVREQARREFYAPLTSATFDDDGSPNFELRAVGNPQAQIKSVRDRIRDVDPNLVVESVQTEGDLLTNSILSQLLVARLSAVFGGLVLALVCVGLYGVMSYTVVARTREIGVRMALGARRGDVVWVVAREACFVLVLGAAIGIPAGISATRLFRAMLFGVGAADPISIAAAGGALIAVSLVAAIVPARRATKVDPMVALRYE